MPEQWYAVIDADGELVSSGTVLADPLPTGLAAIPVDPPRPGQVWDPGEVDWVSLPAPAPEPTPVDVLAELSVVAGDESKTMPEKLEAIMVILAAAGGGADTGET